MFTAGLDYVLMFQFICSLVVVSLSDIDTKKRETSFGLQTKQNRAWQTLDS